MSFKIDLQPDETLIFQSYATGPRTIMSLGVSDRAVFMLRDQHFHVRSTYMHRVPLSDITEVSVRRVINPLTWVVGAIFVPIGLLGLFAIFTTVSNSVPKQPSAAKAGLFAFAMVILGIAYPLAGRGRRSLTIATRKKRFTWRPLVFDNKIKANKLQEDFLWMCRFMGIPTRRFDIVGNGNIDRFWRWFSSHAASGSIDEEQFRRRVKELCADIDILVSDKADVTRELIITANWKRDLVPVVEQILDAAPTVPGWTISAFHPRRDLEDTIEIDGEEFITDYVYFVPYTDGFNFVVGIFFKGDQENENTRLAAWQMIKTVLGEHDFLMKVKHFELGDIEEVDEESLQPIRNLPNFVDELIRSTSN